MEIVILHSLSSKIILISIINIYNKKPNTVRLTDTATPIFTNRWKKLPHECITVDELKFYRRRKPSGIFHGSIFQ